MCCVAACRVTVCCCVALCVCRVAIHACFATNTNNLLKQSPRYNIMRPARHHKLHTENVIRRKSERHRDEPQHSAYTTISTSGEVQVHAPIFLNLSHSRCFLSRPHQINYRNIETCLEEHRTSYFLLPRGAHAPFGATHATSHPPLLAATWTQEKKHNSIRGFPLQRSPTPSQMFCNASSSSELRLMPVSLNFSCSFSNLFLPSRVLAHVARSETPASYGTLCNIVLHLTRVSTAGLCNPVIKFCAALVLQLPATTCEICPKRYPARQITSNFWLSV